MIKPFFRRLFDFLVHGLPVVNIKAEIHTLSLNQLLENRVAFITGGTSGIGYQIALAYLNSGANVIITSRSKEKLDLALKKISCQFNDKIWGIVLDNVNIDSFEDKINECISHFGKIDILVNNAGVLTYDNISTENENKYDQVLDTNLKGPFFLSQIIGRYWIKNNIKGNILNICSSSSLRPAVSAYTLSKWGIRGLTLGLAKMFASHGITVNGLAPGPTLTNMVFNHDSIENLYIRNIPLGRFILPEEIANMAVVLVSNMGRSIMGDIIYMTGGSGLLTYEDMSYKFNV